MTRYTLLSAPRAEILAVAEQQGIVQWPSRMRKNPKMMKSDKYCLFHKDRGHGTEDCFHLRDEIEKLIRRGKAKPKLVSSNSINVPSEAKIPNPGGYQRRNRRPKTSKRMLRKLSEGESNNQSIVKSGILSKENATVTTDEVPTEKSKEGEPQANKKRKVDEERIEPIEEVKTIELTQEHIPKTAKIGTLLDPQLEKTLIAFLQDNIIVFAWDVADMCEIDPKIIVHRLNVNPKIRPVKQKKMAFGNERIKAIKEEVEKLLRTDYIRPV
ncbi:hypothetical protein Sango_2046500 [Sesamum angolense]|uniref:Uncharacterized protein n=1 Tax=Sesamum angolense TaxID=2727404 RepID=A0AAE2BP80_9LAMI|nr:hypothetical protein Sango_2046500 [Sesamum angolense]